MLMETPRPRRKRGRPGAFEAVGVLVAILGHRTHEAGQKVEEVCLRNI